MLEQLRAVATSIIRRLPRPGPVLRNSARIGTAVAGLLGFQQLANAQDATPFDSGINNRIEPPITAGFASGAQLMPDVLDHRFRMTFAAQQPDPISFDHTDIYGTSFEVDDAGDGGIVIRRINSVAAIPGLDDPLAAEGTALEINTDRGDGRGRIRRLSGGSYSPDGGAITEDGESRGFEASAECPHGNLTGIHPGIRGTNTIRIAAAMPVGGRPVGSQDIWREIDVNAPDFCEYLQAAISASGDDPVGAGLVDEIESSPSLDDLSGPIDPIRGELSGVTRRDRVGFGNHTHIFAHTPAGTRYLQRNADGTWTEESPQTATADPLGYLWSILQRTTPGGREVTIVTYKVRRAEDGATIIMAMALEKTGPTTWREVHITMEVDEDTIIDTDRDGVPDSEDNAWRRANPDQTDESGPEGEADGVGDAGQADCRISIGGGGYAGVDEPGATNDSGLRVCPVSELGYAFAFGEEDGSTIHSNMDVQLDGVGNIVPQPGQTFRYIHSHAPRTEAAPSRRIIFPGGNSVSVQVYSTTHPDGTAGTGTLTYVPLSDPFSTPPPIVFSGPGVQTLPPVRTAELGLEGSDVEVTVGTENLPTGCPPVCEPAPDAGEGEGEDAGADAGEGEDAGADAGVDADADGGADPDAGVDGGESEAESEAEAEAESEAESEAEAEAESEGENKDGGMDPDMGEIVDGMGADAEIPADGGPVGTDMGNTNEPGPGCGCDVGKNPSPENSNSPLSAPGILLVVGGGALALRRRKVREQIRETVQ